jgi:hypothetical protein
VREARDSREHACGSLRKIMRGREHVYVCKRKSACAKESAYVRACIRSPGGKKWHQTMRVGESGRAWGEHLWSISFPKLESLALNSHSLVSIPDSSLELQRSSSACPLVLHSFTHSHMLCLSSLHF